jgi:hypothetical protein
MFSAFLNNLMVWRHCWIIFCISDEGKIKIIYKYYKRNKNLKRNRTDRMWAYSKHEQLGIKWDILLHNAKVG